MNDTELMQMIADHYLGEAQMLTTGAESNLLKLAELRGNMTSEQTLRWDAIKKDFLRNKAMGGDSADVGGKVVVQLADMVEGINKLTHIAAKPQVQEYSGIDVDKLLKNISGIVAQFGQTMKTSQPKVEVINQPLPGMDKILSALAETIEGSILPLVRNMDKKLDIDLRNHEKMQEVSNQLRQLESDLKKQSDFKKQSDLKQTTAKPIAE
jgi:hypothetical protein